MSRHRRHTARKDRRERGPAGRLGFLASGVRVVKDGELVYVYLDTPEAVRLAPTFLPPTKRGVAPDGAEVWVYRGDPGRAA